jgi:hypothetical protein
MMGDTLYQSAMLENLEYEVNRLQEQMGQLYFHIDFLLGGVPTTTLNGGLGFLSRQLVVGVESTFTNRPQNPYGSTQEVSIDVSGKAGDGAWQEVGFLGPFIYENGVNSPTTYVGEYARPGTSGFYGLERISFRKGEETAGPANTTRIYTARMPASQGWNWGIFRNFSLGTGTLTVYPSGVLGSATGQIFVTNGGNQLPVRASYTDADGVNWSGHIVLTFTETVITSTAEIRSYVGPAIYTRFASPVANGILYTVAATWMPARSASAVKKISIAPITFDFYTVSLAPTVHPAFLATAPATLTLRPTSSIGFALPKFNVDVDRIIRSVNRMSKKGIRVGELAKKGGKVLTTVAAVFACFPLSEEIAIPLAAAGVTVRKGGEAVSYISSKAEVASERLSDNGYLHEPLSTYFKDASRVGVPLLGAAARGIGSQIKDEAISLGVEAIGELVADVALGIL